MPVLHQGEHSAATTITFMTFSPAKGPESSSWSISESDASESAQSSSSSPSSAASGSFRSKYFLKSHVSSSTAGIGEDLVAFGFGALSTTFALLSSANSELSGLGRGADDLGFEPGGGGAGAVASGMTNSGCGLSTDGRITGESGAGSFGMVTGGGAAAGLSAPVTTDPFREAGVSSSRPLRSAPFLLEAASCVGAGAGAAAPRTLAASPPEPYRPTGGTVPLRFKTYKHSARTRKHTRRFQTKTSKRIKAENTSRARRSRRPARHHHPPLPPPPRRERGGSPAPEANSSSSSSSSPARSTAASFSPSSARRTTPASRRRGRGRGGGGARRASLPARPS